MYSNADNLPTRIWEDAGEYDALHDDYKTASKNAHGKNDRIRTWASRERKKEDKK